MDFFQTRVCCRPHPLRPWRWSSAIYAPPQQDATAFREPACSSAAGVLAAQRRCVHAFELQAVSVGKKDRIVAACLIVLRVVSRRVENRGADAQKALIHTIHFLAAIDFPCQMVKSRRITIVEALGAVSAGSSQVDRVRSPKG